MSLLFKLCCVYVMFSEREECEHCIRTQQVNKRHADEQGWNHVYNSIQRQHS